MLTRQKGLGLKRLTETMAAPSSLSLIFLLSMWQAKLSLKHIKPTSSLEPVLQPAKFQVPSRNRANATIIWTEEDLLA
jgi:hypothetical protein